MRFLIGTKWKQAGKNGNVCEVVNFLTTRNIAGSVVREEYLSAHDFCGQRVTHEDCETTIARGIYRLTGEFPD